MAMEPVLPDQAIGEAGPDGMTVVGAAPDEQQTASPSGGGAGGAPGDPGGSRPGGPPGGRAGGIWHRRLPVRKPPKLVRGSGVTVHGQIEDWLADAIATGRLTPGDRLPTEQDLAGWLGVSRMTLRHALAQLAQRGLVSRTVGRSGGTFVAEPKLEQDLTVLAGVSEPPPPPRLVPAA